jgi:hypothetical protein
MISEIKAIGDAERPAIPVKLHNDGNVGRADAKHQHAGDRLQRTHHLMHRQPRRRV